MLILCNNARIEQQHGTTNATKNYQLSQDKTEIKKKLNRYNKSHRCHLVIITDQCGSDISSILQVLKLTTGNGITWEVHGNFTYLIAVPAQRTLTHQLSFPFISDRSWWVPFLHNPPNSTKATPQLPLPQQAIHTASTGAAPPRRHIPPS